MFSLLYIWSRRAINQLKRVSRLTLITLLAAALLLLLSQLYFPVSPATARSNEFEPGGNAITSGNTGPIGDPTPIMDGYPYLQFALEIKEHEPFELDMSYTPVAEVPDGWIGVYTAEDLDNIRNDLAANYLQMADIDLSGYANWNPLGDCSDSFTGMFDGNGYTINNLTIDTFADGLSTNFIGLFGSAAGAGFTRVVLIDINITYHYNPKFDPSYAAGALVGRANDTTIIYCYSTGEITGQDNYMGGVVGEINRGLLSSSYSTVTINIEEFWTGWIGGLAGWVQNSEIISSYSTGDVIASGRQSGIIMGGLVGRCEDTIITKSYATGKVIGHYWIGGLAGLALDCSIIDSFATGTVEGDANVGGLVGQAGCQFQGGGGIISNSSASGNVSGSSLTGGLVGDLYKGSVYYSRAYGNVTSIGRTGGLIGRSIESTVEYSFAKGNVSGNYDVGGFIGYCSNSGRPVRYCFAEGDVTLTGEYPYWPRIGGFIGVHYGTNMPGTDIIDCYARGNVTADGENQICRIGGLTGWQALSAVRNCYAAGLVEAANERSIVGGLIGENRMDTVEVFNSYYDTEVSGQSDDDSRGEPRTTAQMKLRSNYVGWDFETVWAGCAVSYVDPVEPYWQVEAPFTVTATTADEDVASVQLWYRYSLDNWTDDVALKKHEWQLFGVDSDTSGGFAWSFNAPHGYGYYEFYSIAVDGDGNPMEIKVNADAGARYAKDLVAIAVIMSRPEETPPLFKDRPSDHYESIAEQVRQYYDEASYGSLAITAIEHLRQ